MFPNFFPCVYLAKEFICKHNAKHATAEIQSANQRKQNVGPECEYTLKDFKNAKNEIHKIYLFLVYQFY